MPTFLLDSVRKSARLAEDRRPFNVTPDDYVPIHCAERWGGVQSQRKQLYSRVWAFMCARLPYVARRLAA